MRRATPAARIESKSSGRRGVAGAFRIEEQEEDTVRPTEPLRREHEELLSHIDHLGQAAREVARLDRAERELLVGRILDFLTGTLVPHAEAEEKVLYPEWAKLIGFDAAPVPMVHDHEAIVARVERLERADIDDVDTLQELLYGLYALIGTHFRKEEDIQLPAFDAAPEVTAAVLERMGALAGHAHEH
jgi:iron-sulfur cluster repair protein YtfE (RIC family)